VSLLKNAEILAWGVPLSFVVLGALLFLVRLVRLRRRIPPDPEALVLGAVSESLQDRGRLAASLGELRTVHERILEVLPFGLLWVDQRNRVSALNAEGRRLLGVQPGVVGLEASFVLEPFPWLLEGLTRPSGDVWRHEGGSHIWRLRRIEAPDQVGALLQFEDVTEAEVEARRLALRERFADLGEMTAGVAHQLKNGLAVLKVQGQLLARQGHADAASALLEETEGLERLVQRFLQWARPLEPRCQDMDLAEVARLALDEVRRRPLSMGRRLECLGEGRALADPMLLQQALVNLLENACQATPSGGRILVRVATGRLEILDEGPGLGEETLARMLKPFESGRPEGTGLGLPLALKWVNAQGADLRFERLPAGGTQVTVVW